MAEASAQEAVRVTLRKLAPSHRGARGVLKCGRTTGGELSELEGDDT